jgi:hypothetical protein
LDRRGSTVNTRVSGTWTNARPLYFRLASGGDSPDLTSFYDGWTNRDVDTTIDFTGGDKDFTSFRDYLSAMQTRIWEIGGGAR